MNRRGFINAIASAVGAGLIVPDLARELLVPARTIILPPAEGWPPGLLDTHLIAREALRILANSLRFTSDVNRAYFLTTETLYVRKPAVLTICRPPRYRLS